MRGRIICITQKKYFVRVQKFFSARTKKSPSIYDDNRQQTQESRLPYKVALCHNKVNSKVSSCQKTRTEGKAKDSRTKPEVFPMYHNVSISCFAFFRSVRLQFCTKVHIRTQRNCLTGKREINSSIQEFNCTFGACTDNNYQ